MVGVRIQPQIEKLKQSIMNQTILFQGRIMFQCQANSSDELYSKMLHSDISKIDKEICSLILRTNKLRKSAFTYFEKLQIEAMFNNEIFKLI